MMCNSVNAQEVVRDAEGRYPVYCMLITYGFLKMGEESCVVDFGFAP